MSGQPKAYIVDLSMITPIGADTSMTAASIKANINQYQETDFFDQNYEPIRMALVPDAAFTVNLEKLSTISSLSAREARLLQLAGTAALQLQPMLSNREPIATFIAKPCPLSPSEPESGVSFFTNLSALANISIDLQNSRCFYSGRAGGMQAIDLAIRYLEASPQKYALVGGVDTFYDLDIIKHYVESGRLLTPGSMDGFIPGEAASFLLLGSTNVTELSKKDTITGIFGLGLSQESGCILNDQPYQGDGLTSAFNLALKQAPPREITQVYSSMNGEAFWAKELGVASMRHQQYIHDDCITHHPADCFGDLGAAMATTLIGLASIDIQARKHFGSSLVYASSDSECRGAVRVALLQH